MTFTYLTELALRAAVHTTNKELSSDQNHAEAIKKTALERAQQLVQSHSTSSSMASQFSAQSEAIALAVVGLELAYQAVHKQVELLNNRRLSFDKERQAGIATFLIPSNVEEAAYTHEEAAIKAFNTLAFASPLSPYFGIHTARLEEEKKADFYSVLPFYRMSEQLEHPVASTQSTDKERNAINLFFQSALPDAISDLDMDFQTDTKFIEFFVSAFEQSNYLNDLRAPRYIMMCLANLLWNLQHPVDPTSGFPLSHDQSVELCRHAELFLNHLLDMDTRPFLQDISNDTNHLISFVRKVEVHVKSLRIAYSEEQLHALNVEDVTNSAHHAVRIMDKSVFKLIYRIDNPTTKRKEPNERAAAELADIIGYLNELLQLNPSLLKQFQNYEYLIPEAALMNKPPITVIDILILFCHLPYFKRDELYEKLKATSCDSALELMETLKRFDTLFVKPIKEISKRELQVTAFHHQYIEVAARTAKRLIPLVTLVIEDFRLEVDTQFSVEQARKPSSAIKLIGKQQVLAINKMAEAGDGYYQWVISPYISLASTVDKFDSLPKHQYRISKMTRLLDSIREIVRKYRDFLLHASFQQFLIKCLNQVQQEFKILGERVQALDTYLAGNEHISRGLQAILRPLTRDLNTSLHAVRTAASSFEQVIAAPDFTEHQKEELAQKIEIVNQQYTDLFTEPTGIEWPFTEATSNPLPTHTDSSVSLSFIPAKQALALRKLVQQCYDGLSFQSRLGHKGELLRDLLTLIDNQPNFTEEQLKHVILELVRVTASYRPTWFFQAAYGQTRSAQTLIAAIKNPEINRQLPLASLLFGKDINIATLSNEKIILQLKGLREQNHWQESANQIEVVNAF
ncbi:hypothetical protein [Legionella impletisoli]|uniref:Uncharacterized protein n=1 Tax=Legionella impletisoli TaxID=343510 RepID=A0A917NBH6_9GAMM|nr:hypothetical protein [Legionella impletisoli]GGI86262.1 hypothetical protein GCM10007966_13580 [Legionella impletisoli]